MITQFKIDNFKSLVDFELPPVGHELGGFTCLIGLNGSGKSTLLQAFDFIAQVATGGIANWLERREWKKTELVSQIGTRRPLISFAVTLRTKTGNALEWQARYNSTHMRCTWEQITSEGTTLLKVDDGWISMAKGGTASPDTRGEKIQFEYQGSVISALKLTEADPRIGEVKSALQSLRSLELLSPQLMRRKARSAQDIGPSGEKLAPFLDQLPMTSKAELLRMLQEFYPQLRAWNVKGQRYGWKNLRIHESFASSSPVDAGHINDGFLRVIAVLSQGFTSHEMILLDEIENGINPAIVEKLMDFLVGLGSQGKQVIVSTHSPVILNFLEDKVARDAVILLYKTADGRTQACRYFDLPETSYKLKALGPGEVFADTDLNKLVDRLAAERATATANAGSGK